MSIEILGYIAACLTTSSFVPQAIRFYKAKNKEAVSLPAYLMLLMGLVAWSIYGIMIFSWPIIIANITCALLCGAIVVRKLI